MCNHPSCSRASSITSFRSSTTLADDSKIYYRDARKKVNTGTNPGDESRPGTVSSTLQSNSFFRNGTSRDSRLRVTTEPIDLKGNDTELFSASLTSTVLRSKSVITGPLIICEKILLVPRRSLS